MYFHWSGLISCFYGVTKSRTQLSAYHHHHRELAQCGSEYLAYPWRATLEPGVLLAFIGAFLFYVLGTLVMNTYSRISSMKSAQIRRNTYKTGLRKAPRPNAHSYWTTKHGLLQPIFWGMMYLYRDIWGGHGNPLQYSCLENPMNREAWRATVHRVAQSRTWLKRLNNAQRDTEGTLLYPLLFRAIKVSDSKYFWRFIFSSFPIIHPSSIPHLSPAWFHILFYPRLIFKPYPTPQAPEIVSTDTPFYQQNQKGVDWPAGEIPSAGQHVTSQGQPQKDLCNYATSSRITVTFKAPSTNSILSIELKPPQPQWGDGVGAGVAVQLGKGVENSPTTDPGKRGSYPMPELQKAHTSQQHKVVCQLSLNEKTINLRV